MSNVNVIDASAILAYLQQEQGQDVVESALDAGPSWMTAVNYCEVLGKLCENGMPAEEAQAAIDDLGLTLTDFDVDLARLAAATRVRTKPIGASLGDRACLALAERFARTHATPIVYTAEQSWTKLKWPFKVVLIRAAKRTT
ncbi:MAG: type II toxin-antitoxin system VapC family toxin [Tepidisphaeraceae bacterium]